MTGLAVALAVTAAIAGVTGTWSPCGLSMVETLGRPGGRRTTFAACVTFGGLALVGRALHAGIGSGALAVAAAVAAIAAYAEARGLRVLPQIRRQVPEPWRRVMPLPLAAALYGILLGLGFTTFVLTVATWALAGLSLAIGEPWVGAVVGLAFGAGRERRARREGRAPPAPVAPERLDHRQPARRPGPGDAGQRARGGQDDGDPAQQCTCVS